jgi:hypothetical protein
LVSARQADFSGSNGEPVTGTRNREGAKLYSSGRSRSSSIPENLLRLTFSKARNM